MVSKDSVFGKLAPRQKYRGGRVWWSKVSSFMAVGKQSRRTASGPGLVPKVTPPLPTQLLPEVCFPYSSGGSKAIRLTVQFDFHIE